MKRSFAVNWDYRCPFARNAHEHLLAGLDAGAEWEVRFLAFSLEQAHVAEHGTPVWDEADRHPGLVANLAGIVVRDRFPQLFPRVHGALFSARHDQALDLRDRDVLLKVLNEAGVDGGDVLAEVDDGWPLEILKTEHTDSVERQAVFGVPTFITGDDAVFVRLMHRPAGDGALATSSIEKVLYLMAGWPELNEFKHTAVLR
jgi:predicted DsbA family dithiol-disulfide isomerase